MNPQLVVSKTLLFFYFSIPFQRSAVQGLKSYAAQTIGNPKTLTTIE